MYQVLRRKKQGPGLAETEVKHEGAVHQAVPHPFRDRHQRCADRVRQCRSSRAREVQDELEVPAANARYTGQHTFDVGDVPGHQVRIFELRRTFPDDQPNCEGLKRVEQWMRGYSDYVDRNGPPGATR